MIDQQAEPTDIHGEQQTEQPIEPQHVLSHIGDTTSLFISKCRGGGYLVVVDGTLAAFTTLDQALAGVRTVTAAKYEHSSPQPQHDDGRFPRILRRDHAKVAAGIAFAV